VLNFYQINKNDKIRTHDHLVIKTLIPYVKEPIQLKRLNF
jgi:hypothetical protein